MYLSHIVKQVAQFTKSLCIHYNCILCYQSSNGALCSYCQHALSKESIAHKRRILQIHDKTIHIYGFNHYNGYTRKLLFMFKYNKNHLAGKALSDYFTNVFQKQKNLADVDLIIPVPSHRLRFLYRGFNQAEVLAKSIYKPPFNHLDQHVLHKCKYTKPQAKSDFEKRQQQLSGTIQQRYPIQAKHLLIVDDVITTGSTIKTILTTLLENRKNKIDKITVIALCRV